MHEKIDILLGTKNPVNQSYDQSTPIATNMTRTLKQSVFSRKSARKTAEIYQQTFGNDNFDDVSEHGRLNSIENGPRSS